MVSSRGLPPVRICNARIVFFARSRPETVRHRCRAVVRIEPVQRCRPEQVVEGKVSLVDLVEPAGCACQKEEPGIVLERLAQPPSRIVVRDVPEHHVQVLDDQDEAPAFAIRKILENAEAAVAERPVVPDLPQLLIGAVQVRAVVLARHLVRQTGQALEPEFAGGRHLVAFLREDDREEARRQIGIPTYLGRDP